MTKPHSIQQLVDSAEFKKSVAILKNLSETNPKAYALLIGAVQVRAFQLLNTHCAADKDQEVV